MANCIFIYDLAPQMSGSRFMYCGQSDIRALQVRLFNLSRLRRNGTEESGISPSAVFQCHTRRVKKLAVISSFYISISLCV